MGTTKISNRAHAQMDAAEIGYDIAETMGTDQVQPWVDAYVRWSWIVKTLGYSAAVRLTAKAAADLLTSKQA